MIKQGNSGNREQKGTRRTRERVKNKNEDYFSLLKYKTLSLAFKIEMHGTYLMIVLLFAKSRLYEK